MNAIAYELLLPPTLQIHLVFHVSFLRAYDVRRERLHSLPPDSIHVAGATEHVADRVLRHRHRGCGLQYLVYWEGYDMADATWEPEGHLVNAPAKVSECWKCLETCNAGWSRKMP